MNVKLQRKRRIITLVLDSWCIKQILSLVNIAKLHLSWFKILLNLCKRFNFVLKNVQMEFI